MGRETRFNYITPTKICTVRNSWNTTKPCMVSHLVRQLGFMVQNLVITLIRVPLLSRKALKF